jgi:hypothetical protein
MAEAEKYEPCMAVSVSEEGKAASPSVLVSFGNECRDVLKEAELAGAFVACP